MINKNDDFLNLLGNKKLNEEQLNALRVDLEKQEKGADSKINTNGNAVIAAGAGSGKTQVLATRFAWLILTGQAKVEEILTLTFTKKAAAEMYQRIYKTLSMFEQSEDLNEEKRNLAREALNNFANAHIQTLDSYCGKILRQNAGKYGIRPDFTTGSADASIEIKKKAFKFILKHKNECGIQTFAQPGKLQNFAEDSFGAAIEKYTSLATKENYFTDKLKIQVKEAVKAWNYYILGKKEDIHYIISDNKYIPISEIIENIESYLEETKITDKNYNYVQAVSNFIDSVRVLTDLPLLDSNDIITYSDNLNNQISNLEAFLAKADNLVIAFKTGYIKKIKTIFTKLNSVYSLLYKSIIAFMKNYNSILSLDNLFDEFLNEINSSKRTSGNLSFNDVSEMSIKILLENEDIRNQEKNAFKKIMIDEFQDNNGKNRDLLYLISLKDGAFEDNGKCVISVTEENPLINQIIVRDNNGQIIEDKRSRNKLFFVGDEKQSIYKFRGADVSVFNELTKDREENALFRMTRNYRSTPELIKAFNIFFKNGNGIFGTDEKKVYEAYYDKDAVSKNEECIKLTSSNVPIHINILKNFDKASKKIYVSEKEQVAYNIAKKIYEMGRENKNWNNFAILQRSRTDSGIITKYLNMFNIPYSIDQFNNIFEEGIINDFYNFFRLCVYPSDEASFASYLASPLCGLNENSLEFILSHLIPFANQSNTAIADIEDESVQNKIKKDLDNIDSESFTKYINAIKFYKENKKTVLQNKITTTLSYLWNTKGYRYETYLSEKSQLISEHFDMFFELGRQTDESGKSISWFIDQLSILKNKYSQKDADIDVKEISYPFEKGNSVQIMTIHKSKGLEFENVFIYGCIDVTSRSSGATIFYDEKTGVSVKPDTGEQNYFSLIGQDKFRQEEIAEFRRLIYVAVTRAKNSVYIFGNCNIDSDSTNPLRLIENTINKFYKDAKEGYNFCENNEDVSFDYTILPPIEYNKLINIYENENIKTIDEQRKNAINNTEKIYKTAEIINYQNNAITRKTPSSLEPSVENHEESKEGIIINQPIDDIISPVFTAAEFGTLVHAYQEAQVHNISLEDYEPDIKLLKNLEEKDIKKLKEICIEMCLNFKKSKLGQALEYAKNNGNFYRAEWGFKMFYQGAIFSGSMDLIFGNDDKTYTIVDYKTDKKIEPENYISQQHCYRAAAAKLLNVEEKNISLYLYYLRHDIIEKID